MFQQSVRKDAEPAVGAASNTGVVYTSLAAIGGIMAASTCCLPVLPFVAAAGLAGGSELLRSARPYLLALSVAFIAFGFRQSMRANKCRRKPRLLASTLLWASTLFVAISILFPQVMANCLAGLFPR